MTFEEYQYDMMKFLDKESTTNSTAYAYGVEVPGTDFVPRFDKDSYKCNYMAARAVNDIVKERLYPTTRTGGMHQAAQWVVEKPPKGWVEIPYDKRKASDLAAIIYRGHRPGNHGHVFIIGSDINTMYEASASKGGLVLSPMPKQGEYDKIKIFRPARFRDNPTPPARTLPKRSVRQDAAGGDAADVRAVIQDTFDLPGWDRSKQTYDDMVDDMRREATIAPHSYLSVRTVAGDLAPTDSPQDRLYAPKFELDLRDVLDRMENTDEYKNAVRQDAKGGDNGEGSQEAEAPVQEPAQAVPDGGPRIAVNPAVFKDKRDALCVAMNEAYRVIMELNGFEPQAEPTPAQRRFFADTAYADDEVQLRRTILARICTFDTSIS